MEFPDLDMGNEEMFIFKRKKKPKSSAMSDGRNCENYSSPDHGYTFNHLL